jgi:hypothetical protein
VYTRQRQTRRYNAVSPSGAKNEHKEIPMMLNRRKMLVCGLLVLVLVPLAGLAAGEDTPLRVGSFVVDASPPVGSPLAYDPCVAVGTPLTARGIVLLGSGDPIVLCAVDWIGIANGGQDEWKEAIAKAVGTSTRRVSVHTLHQHDAPRCDFTAAAILEKYGYGGFMIDVAFERRIIANAAEAAKQAAADAQVVTHLGLGEAKVEQVASTRRILGDDGKVKFVRYTACKNAAMRAEPEGTIDPMLKSISFWNGDTPLVVLTYYATHPQSYYRTGVANPDFPGMARFLREATLNGLPHIHFNGAGGDVGAGKYNDGSHENRQILAIRVAEGMAKAFEATKKFPITAADVDWKTLPVALPPSRHLDEAQLIAAITDPETTPTDRKNSAKNLVWLRRCQAGETVDLACLILGPARILHMPGELVVEYQLAAQQMRPDLFVAMAAYGEYAPGYICLKEQYSQGGYEDSPGASKVAPEVEDVLMPAMEKLLK